MLDCVLRRRAPQVGDTDGARAEQLAETHLRHHGARILARNVRFRGGELDIVALHDGCVAFVEVRLRQREDFGGAAASITLAKRRRVILAARQWLVKDGRAYAGYGCRFDAVTLHRLDAASIDWLQGAFDADGL